MHDAGGDRSQTVAALDRIIPALEWSLLLGGGLVIARLLLTMVVAVRHGRRRRRLDGNAPRWWGPVSVVVPAYNENATITATVSTGSIPPGLG